MKVKTIAVIVPLTIAMGVISSPGASAMYAVPSSEDGKVISSHSSPIQNFYNNPIVEKVAVAIANKATMTPTAGMAVTQTITTNGGLSQTILGVTAVAKSYAPYIAAALSGLLSFGANG